MGGLYPKLPGRPSLVTEEGALIGRLDFGTERVATATMACKWADTDHEEALAPARTPQFGWRIAPLRSGGFEQFSLRTHFEVVHDYLAHDRPSRMTSATGVASWPADLKP